MNEGIWPIPDAGEYEYGPTTSGGWGGWGGAEAPSRAAAYSYVIPAAHAPQQATDTRLSADQASYYSNYWAGVEDELYGFVPPSFARHRGFFIAGAQQATSAANSSEWAPSRAPFPNLRDFQNFQDPTGNPQAGIFDVDPFKAYPSEEIRQPGAPNPFGDLIGLPQDVFFNRDGVNPIFGIPTVNTAPISNPEWMLSPGLSGNTFQQPGILFDTGGPRTHFKDGIIDPSGFFPDQ